MTDDYAAEHDTLPAPLPARTFLIGADSGDTIGSIDYMPAEPGEVIKLGPAFGPPGTQVTVMGSRTVDGNDGEPLHVLEVGRKRRPGGDLGQS